MCVDQQTPVDDFHTNEVCRFPCAPAAKLLLQVACVFSSVFRIRDVWIRGSVSLEYGSGFGSCSFLQWLSRCHQKHMFLSQNQNQGFFSGVCLLLEGSRAESGSVQIIDSDPGSGRHKNLLIQNTSFPLVLNLVCYGIPVHI
jgi:hypothetical protein